MLTRKIFAAVFAAALAGPVAVSAQQVSEGEASLAESLGLTPGYYSMEQMTTLKGIQDQGNNASEVRTDQILANPAGPLAPDMMDDPDAGVSAGERQLSMMLGVEPGEYSLNQLQLIAEGERNESRRQLYTAVLEGELDVSADNDRGEVTPQKQQLAAQLDEVEDPAAYTTRELVLMIAERNVSSDGSTAAN